MTQATFGLRGRNPDVLTCIANLSNDEVFTPPELANQMLDAVEEAWAANHAGESIWQDSSLTFLDPFTKSGVFLREITKRLVVGLEKEIPDLAERVDHILTNQVYGIAITELTALLARRSLYCSKWANGEHSIASTLSTDQGNVWFERIEHTWEKKRCQLCGASRAEYSRSDTLETHAYLLIHTTHPRGRVAEIFGAEMNFDVIVGNPPYQLNDGGGVGSSAIPIYHRFVEQAKALDPQLLAMVTPSRWFTGGRGLNDFRDGMLNDARLRELHDFPDASDVFPGVEIKGGVSYFLWSRDHEGLCRVTTQIDGGTKSTAERPLLEEGFDHFIRYNELISILQKVGAKSDKTFDTLVSANDPFGFDVREPNSYRRVKPELKDTPFPDCVGIYYFGWRKNGLGYVRRSSVVKGEDLIDKYKVFIPKAWGVGDPETDWLSPFIGEPGTASTETYLAIGPFSSRKKASNAMAFIQTRFFHALVAAVKITQNTMQYAYQCVPVPDFTRPWTDKELYEEYGLSADDIQFIEGWIRPGEVLDRG